MHADDPLAFGIEQLRGAAVTYRTDLDRIMHSIPDSPNEALTRAQTALGRDQTHQRDATEAVADRRSALVHLSQRHWYQRDKIAVATARAELRTAGDTLVLANEAVAQSEQRVTDLQQSVKTWEVAFDATAGARTRLIGAVSALYDALDRTLTDRVAAAATDPTHDLWKTLGPPPTTRGGLAAWCGIAEQLEAWNDRHPAQEHGAVDTTNPGAINDRRALAARKQLGGLSVVPSNAAHIINIASRLDPTPAGAPEDPRAWQAALETAQRVLAAERSMPELEHDLGLEL